MNDGQDARAGATRAVYSRKQRAGSSAANDTDFGDPASERAFGGFEFQDHAPRNFILADELLDFAAAHGAQNFLAVEHASDVGEKNQPIGADKFRSGSGHVVRVDVVKLAIGAETEARRDWDDPRAPQRAKKIHIHFGEIADEAEAALTFIELHRLGEKTRRIRSADAYGGLPSQGNRACQTLIQQAAEHHHGRVARFAIGYAQAADEAAGDAHARQSCGENSSAAMNHQQFVAGARELGDLPRDGLHGFFIFEQRACNFNYQSHSKPAVSGNPHIRFMFCTAWPAAPLPRLSRQETTTRRSPAGSSANPMSQKLVWVTCCNSGKRGCARTRTSGRAAKYWRYSASISSARRAGF